MNLVLNPFDKGRKPEVIDEVKADNSGIERAVERFFEIPKDEFAYQEFKVSVLNPTEISVVYKILSRIKDREIDATCYVSNLMMASLAAGYNDFFISSDSTYFNSNLNGKKGNLLRLTLDCDVGQEAFSCNEYLKLVINGNIYEDPLALVQHPLSLMFRPAFEDYAFGQSKHCHVTINGNVNVPLGYNAMYSRFRVLGDALSLGDWAFHSSFYVKGDVGEFCGRKSVACKFLTHNPETFKKLEQVVSTESKVILL